MINLNTFKITLKILGKFCTLALFCGLFQTCIPIEKIAILDDLLNCWFICYPPSPSYYNYECFHCTYARMDSIFLISSTVQYAIRFLTVTNFNFLNLSRHKSMNIEYYRQLESLFFGLKKVFIYIYIFFMCYPKFQCMIVLFELKSFRNKEFKFNKIQIVEALSGEPIGNQAGQFCQIRQEKIVTQRTQLLNSVCLFTEVARIKI